MIAKTAMGLPLKGLRLAIKSSDTLIQTAGTQALRLKTWFDEDKASEVGTVTHKINKLSTVSANDSISAKVSTDLSDSSASIDPINLKELEFKKAPINWIPATILIATPIAAAVITPWYLFTHQVSAPVWGVFGAFMVWTGMSITAGYHRLLAHRAYKAHPIVKNFLLLGSTLAVQGSAFDWVSGHRSHHRHVDDPMDDPYSAKRGFL